MSKKSIKKYIQGIISAGKNLLDLINDILDLSKIEAGKLEIKPEKNDINLIINELMQVFRLKAEEKGLEFSYILSEKVPKILNIDELRVKQILLNLIGNALKFTEEGFVKVVLREVKVNTETRKCDIAIDVEDSGIGIPTEQQERIFESFTQQDGQSTRKYGGTGLGLTILRKLAEKMNGIIELESTIGRGSKFSLVIRDVDYYEDKYVSIGNNIDNKYEYTFEKAKILIAEDIASNVEVIAGYLEKYNFAILVSENGLDAVKKAKEYKPDIILMDMQMPEMNGYEATTAIKNDNMTKEIKIVAVTASVMPEHEKIIRNICDGYLRKPFRKHELLAELAKHLKHIKIETVNDSKSEAEINVSSENRKRLREKFLSKWTEIEKLILGDEVEAFAKEISSFSEEYNISEMKQYAEKLISCVNEFDVYETEKQFRLFRKIVEEE